MKQVESVKTPEKQKRKAEEMKQVDSVKTQEKQKK